MTTKSQYPIFENSIGDLKIRSVLDLGFYQIFGMTTELHSHIYYEILFAIEESFWIELSGGERIAVKKGELYLIPPGIYHGNDSDSEEARKLAIRFRYEKDIDKLSSDSIWKTFHERLSAFKKGTLFSSDERLNYLIALLREEIGSDQVASKEYLRTIMDQFYICFMRLIGEHAIDTQQNDDSEPSHDDNEGRRLWVEEYFQKYFDQPVSEDHMAKLMNLSRRQVSRILYDFCGSSFRKLLIEERLNRAAQLLVNTDLPIDEVVSMVGYTSVSGFYTAFRQKFGMSAGKYRKEFSNIH